MEQHLPPSCASICPSHCFLQGSLIVPLQDGPAGVAGWLGASWCAAGENKGAVSRAKCFYTFLKYLVPLPSVPRQYLSHLSAPAMLVSVGGLGT